MKFELDFASKIFDVDLEYAKKLKGFEKYKITEENGQLYIEFNSLEELMDYLKTDGTVVLDEKTLTVYDDYIE